MDGLAVSVVDLQEFLDVGLLLGEGEVEDAEVVLVSLSGGGVTRRWRISLLSSMRASLVRQRVELTTVAV